MFTWSSADEAVSLRVLGAGRLSKELVEDVFASFDLLGLICITLYD